jgi:hypothetical protein
MKLTCSRSTTSRFCPSSTAAARRARTSEAHCKFRSPTISATATPSFFGTIVRSIFYLRKVGQYAESAYRQTLTPSRAVGNAGGRLAVRDTEAATARHLVVAYRHDTERV